MHSEEILGYIFDIFTKFSGKQLGKQDLYLVFNMFADVPDTE